jgi:hypothetical protein
VRHTEQLGWGRSVVRRGAAQGVATRSGSMTDSVGRWKNREGGMGHMGCSGRTGWAGLVRQLRPRRIRTRDN